MTAWASRSWRYATWSSTTRSPRASCSRSRSARSRPSTASPSTSAGARPSASWASRAAASPRSPSCWSTWSGRPPGAIRYKGEDITKLSGRALKAVRRNIQMVFQDPYTSLNPRMTVGDIIGEPFEIHPEVAPKGDRRRKVQELLDVVGLNPEYINRYPHQFSGGQRQRIGIARGLALQPGDHRRGRAGLRPRRLGAGAGHQPDGAAAGRVRPVATSSSRTTCRSSGTSPTGSA